MRRLSRIRINLLRMRVLLLAFLVSGGALLGCSQGSRTATASDDGGATMVDGPTDGGELEIEGCARFGLRFAPTCEACPIEPLGCSCLKDSFGDLGIRPFPRCNFGRCLLSLDCTELCKHAPADLSGTSLPEFVEDYGNANRCVSQRRCRLDSGCGDQGKCVDETAATGGTCTKGDALCFNATDCWSGLCIVARSVCTDGKSGSPCAANENCPAGKCLQYLGPQEGICTDGNSGHPCQTAADCAPGNSCVRSPAGPGADLGTCLAGNTGDWCDSDDQCKSGTCVDMKCSSGEVDSPCSKDQHCKSGICLVPPGGDLGTCGSGENGSYCFSGDDCHSGNCTLKQHDFERGLCTDGKVGDPCQQPADCKTSVCDIPRAPEPNVCNGDLGQACGSGGTCGDVANHLCYHGHCAQ